MFPDFRCIDMEEHIINTINNLHSYTLYHETLYIFNCMVAELPNVLSIAYNAYYIMYNI